MLSTLLIERIEDNAEQLTRSLVIDLKENPLTTEYHKLSPEEIRSRAYDVYHNLGKWLASEAEGAVAARYSNLGKQRAIDGVPLSQVVYALIRTKKHLLEGIPTTGLFDSALGLYQLQEVRRLVHNFFDRAVYYTVRAYEREVALQCASPALAG